MIVSRDREREGDDRLIDFDRPGDPAPLLIDVAISRGRLLVNGPITLIMAGGTIIGLAVLKHYPLLAITCFLADFVLGWLWWSWSIPQWRAWAISRGVDPVRLQEEGVRAHLVWPKGSIFERTEFGRD